MIKINSLNKYYNKNTENELHVINDTTLDLPKTGLISFLGKSGSGKTTLLNVIGGLDKFNSGEIIYDDIILNKYSMKKIDEFRKDNIGYIFQNYLLLENKSVYDNLRIALELNGILDKEEQEKRIEYVLKAVGMFKYRKKQADKLSGGQMQRVSIARALLKECRIIIADEPTGNLDSENTIEIMNILKAISKTTLVLLVTHSHEIASFYSDRIITISDGKINNDVINDSNNNLTVENDNVVYLKDLENKQIQNDIVNLNLYTDTDKQINLRIVVKNDTIYIDSDQLISLTKQSNIKLLDEHKKEIKKSDIKEDTFDISWYSKSKKNPLPTLFLRNLKNSFISFFKARAKSKFFYLFFLIIGFLIGLCFIFVNTYENEFDVISTNEDVYFLHSKNSDYYSYKPLYIAEDAVKAYNDGLLLNVYDKEGFGEYKNITINNTPFSFTSLSVSMRCYFYPLSFSKSTELICGRLPQNNTEVVVGSEFINDINKLSKSNQTITNNDLLNSGHFNNKSYYVDDIEFKIVGIINNKTNSLYYRDIDYYYNSNKYLINHTNYSSYTITSGNTPTVDKPLLINETIKDYINIDNNLISGYFTNNDSLILTNNYDYLSYHIEETTTPNSNYVGYSLSNKNNTLNLYKIVAPNNKLDYEVLDISNSRDIKNDNECLINIRYKSEYQIGDKINNLKVVGYYYHESISNILVNEHTYIINIINYLPSAFVINKNSLEPLSQRFQVLTPYEFQVLANEDGFTKIMYISIIIILFVISIIYIYFSTKSRMIHEIKTIGIYRSIGSTKWQIYRRYLSKIFVETTLTSALSYLITVCVYMFITSKINTLLNTVNNFNPFIFILGFISIYIINIFFGLLPIVKLLSKSPAEINSKYDI